MAMGQHCLEFGEPKDSWDFMDVQPPQNYGSTIDYSNWSIAILEDDQESPHMASATFEHLMLHGYIRLTTSTVHLCSIPCTVYNFSNMGVLKIGDTPKQQVELENDDQPVDFRVFALVCQTNPTMNSGHQSSST